MSTLQKALNGYADFIGRYEGGSINMQDSTVLVPTINIEDFINERKNISFDTNFTAIDQVAGITVPEGKQWRVHFVSAYLSGQAGQQILYELHWRRVFGGSQRYYPVDNEPIRFSFGGVSYEQAANRTRGHSAQPKIIIPSGDGLGVSVSDLIGAGNFATRFVAQITEYNS